MPKNFLFSNTAGVQLTEDGRDFVRSQITEEVKCVICLSKCFLVSANDGDYLACEKAPFEHNTGWKIHYSEKPYIWQPGCLINE
jgi:hypothetical protein